MENSFLLDAYINLTAYKTPAEIIKHISDEQIQSILGYPKWKNLK